MDDTRSAKNTRSVLLRGLWCDAIDGWGTPGAVDQLPAARRLLAAGANRDDLVRLARAVAYEAVFATLETLDGGPVDVGPRRTRRSRPLAVAPAT
ncbi:hypothetical protein [Streptomyces sp. NPDC002276]